MKKIILTALSSLVLCASVQAQAEELIIYAEPITITVTDHGSKGYSLGDTVSRHGTVYFQENGPAVGEYTTLAQITHIYKDRKSDARFYVMEINLPEGEIMTMNFTQIKSGGPTAVEGEKHRGVIVGGTGKYSGIKGTYELQIGTNQKTKIVFKII
jgi:hypothetical protein